MAKYVLAIDQGTTSSRAIIFDARQKVVAVAQKEITQHYPQSGWVEHDANEIWASVRRTVRAALRKAALTAKDIAAIGITNQRETVVVWDKATGEPIHHALVWQDRRTAERCQALKAEGFEEEVTARTGLLLDPYFSGTKLAWLLENVKGARNSAEKGDLLFGTIDCFLVWKLTGGALHATDATNASRTMLFNIAENRWDSVLCAKLGVPEAMLPVVKDCADDFGTTVPNHFGGAIPIRGVAGDQHAALMGQACFEPGMVKSTYGTGCFALINTGTDRVRSRNRLLTTIAYRLDGQTHYALEGSIFIAGAAVQWLRDGLKVIRKAAQASALAATADPTQQVYLVPAFVGLGAPHWDAEARGAMFGLTRNSGPAEFARAALESVAFQTRDLLDAMQQDWAGGKGTVLRVDGGMVASDWTMQRLADILDAPIDRPEILETTALGAAWLAASKVGLWPDAAGFAKTWRRERRFESGLDAVSREKLIAGWREAVRRTLTSS